MPSVVLAQRAVAVEAVKRLHQAGELDDNLMPIGQRYIVLLLAFVSSSYRFASFVRRELCAMRFSNLKMIKARDLV